MCAQSSPFKNVLHAKNTTLIQFVEIKGEKVSPTSCIGIGIGIGIGIVRRSNSCIMCLIRPLTAGAAVQQFVCIPASNARVCCIRSPQTAACPCDQEACRGEPTYLTEVPYEDTKSCG